jgi:S1-C subfamily serine protease
VLSELPALYVIGKSRVSEKALKQLQNDLPDLKIRRRSDAYLGIGVVSQPKGVLIALVQTNSPAARSGLRPYDVITKFDAQPVPDFETLTQLLFTCQPKDKITLTILRGGETFDIMVVLGHWK